MRPLLLFLLAAPAFLLGGAVTAVTSLALAPLVACAYRGLSESSGVSRGQPRNPRLLSSAAENGLGLQPER
ncbi:MAG: hypothetical protein QOJ34_1416 [Pseudonocardiales bacterium]|jgi:hypothetical protein|nr:hypothetical protein [Pseudonocardiales bacterium]